MLRKYFTLINCGNPQFSKVFAKNSVLRFNYLCISAMIFSSIENSIGNTNNFQWRRRGDFYIRQYLCKVMIGK